MGRRRKSVARHLEPAELDRQLEWAQRRGEAALLRRLCLIENVYAGDTLAEAADRVGISQPTASRWTDAWNEDGVDGLRPDRGGGRPPKLDDDARDRLATLVDRDPPETASELAALVEREFAVSFSRRHAARLYDRLVAE